METIQAGSPVTGLCKGKEHIQYAAHLPEKTNAVKTNKKTWARTSKNYLT